MNPLTRSIAARLIPQVVELRQRALALERAHLADIAQIDPGYQDSARNLLHYLALRQMDIRPLQRELAALGLSSLGRLEAHALVTIDAVLYALQKLADQPWTPPDTPAPSVNFRTGQMYLSDHTLTLLGSPSGKRAVRIMVTMSSEAATNPPLVRDLLAAGMDVMRINCAHDDADAWRRMVANLRAAERELGRSCKVYADLAGPKLRTGAIQPIGQGQKVKPRRNIRGQVIAPAQVWLTPEDSPALAPTEVDAILWLPSHFLTRLEPGDEVWLEDARGVRRSFLILEARGHSLLAQTEKTVYLEENTVVHVERDGKRSAEARIHGLPPISPPLDLAVGDTLVLVPEGRLGRHAVRNAAGEVVTPACIPCTLEEVFTAARPGERIWFDDGKIGGLIAANTGDEISVEITQTAPSGGRLRAEKGINLPDTHLSIPALTDKDVADLEFVVKYADIVGLSFVRSPDDVLLLHKHLDALGANQMGVVLKVETRAAFESLPRLLLASLCAPLVGVMVARGDLAVEVGFERLAEVQEEILWLCEAAHVPVIWATQVLESMATKGSPSRAEVSDAVMSGRAECVMLNKGPYIVETVRFLSGILERMDAHQSKKRAMLRRLSVSQMS